MHELGLKPEPKFATFTHQFNQPPTTHHEPYQTTILAHSPANPPLTHSIITKFITISVLHLRAAQPSPAVAGPDINSPILNDHQSRHPPQAPPSNSQPLLSSHHQKQLRLPWSTNSTNSSTAQPSVSSSFRLIRTRNHRTKTAITMHTNDINRAQVSDPESDSSSKSSSSW